MKNYTKVFEQLKKNGLKEVTGYTIWKRLQNYRLYINVKTKQYMVINTNPQIDLSYKISLAKYKLNRSSKCKSVLKLANSNFFEKEALNKELEFKDKLGGFVLAFEIENGQIKIDNSKTIEKNLIKLIRFGFDVKYSNNHISFKKIV